MGIKRTDLARYPVKVLRAGKPWQPDILLVETDGGRCVVKDYKPRGLLCRVGLGLWSVAHEAAMYRRLSGQAGIPRYYGKLDRYALAVEYIPARSAAELKGRPVPAIFFDRLRELVDRIHDRGFVLADLRNRGNVLITETFEPYLVDLCTAFDRGAWFNLPKRLLHRIFFQDDLLGVLKLKRHLAPDLLTREEAERLDRGLFMEKSVVRLRNWCVRWLKKTVR
jgi:hypothetical protein